MRKSVTFAIAASLAVLMSSPIAAKPRPTVGDADTCWDGGSADKGCEGLICYCCYDEGCYICNKDTRDCVWDGSYRAGSHPGRPLEVPPRSSISPPWSTPKDGEKAEPPPAGAGD
jgi:hypothetical protein